MSAFEQQVDRAAYLGSSDIAAILGVSKWKTPYQVWESKQPGYVDYSADPERDVRLRRGTRFEPLILDQYQEETGAWITARNVRYIDHEHDFLRAEVDAEETDEETDEVTNLEVKSVSAYASRDFGESGTDEFPSYYAAQMQYALMVTGRSRSKMVALIGTDDQRQYSMARDEEMIAFMRETAVRFWQDNVLAGVPPPLKDAEDAWRMVERFGGYTVKVTDALRTDLSRLRGIKAAIKRLEYAECQHKFRLQLAMAAGVEAVDCDAAAIVDETGRPLVTWTKGERKGYTVAATTTMTMRLAREKRA